MKPTTEQQLAAPLAPWLKQAGFAVYEEVIWEPDHPIADLVAVRDQYAGVLEVKTSLSAKLLRQAHWWQDLADGVSIVLPSPRGTANRIEREKFFPILQSLGMGLIEIDVVTDPAKPAITVQLRSRSVPGRSERLIQKLRPGHQTSGSAGSAKSDGWTPYKETVKNLHAFVIQNPGCTLKEAVRSIKHHYPNTQKAVSNLLKYADQEGGLRGIRTETVHGLLRLHPQ